MNRYKNNTRRAFTLIELLIVVAIIAILAAIAVVNLRGAIDRALQASDAANLKAIGAALQSYYVDHNTLPPADREAGPFTSHGPGHAKVGNGPAAGGSWDGVPWLLYEWGYVTEWRTLFCPRYLREYRGDTTIRGGWPRYHNFRYAYNSSALSSGGHLGGDGNIMTGRVWLVRDLWLSAKHGWYAQAYPEAPADYTYPWGEDRDLEQVLTAGMAVKMVQGGTDKDPEYSNKE